MTSVLQILSKSLVWATLSQTIHRALIWQIGVIHCSLTFGDSASKGLLQLKNFRNEQISVTQSLLRSGKNSRYIGLSMMYPTCHFLKYIIVHLNWLVATLTIFFSCRTNPHKEGTVKKRKLLKSTKYFKRWQLFFSPPCCVEDGL